MPAHLNCLKDGIEIKEIRGSVMSVAKLWRKAVPYINVTPLIDVLLVLLIIFMVVTPLKPSRFKALVPEPPQAMPGPTPEADVLNLVVTIKQDGALE